MKHHSTPGARPPGDRQSVQAKFLLLPIFNDLNLFVVTGRQRQIAGLQLRPMSCKSGSIDQPSVV
jgi:hypothetical protein